MSPLSDFPRDPTKFKQRADEECRTWPEDLTAKADAAWRYLEGRAGYGPECFDNFATAHAEHRAKAA